MNMNCLPWLLLIMIPWHRWLDLQSVSALLKTKSWFDFQTDFLVSTRLPEDCTAFKGRSVTSSSPMALHIDRAVQPWDCLFNGEFLLPRVHVMFVCNKVWFVYFGDTVDQSFWDYSLVDMMLNLHLFNFGYTNMHWLVLKKHNLAPKYTDQLQFRARLLRFCLTFVLCVFNANWIHKPMTVVYGHFSWPQFVFLCAKLSAVLCYHYMNILWSCDNFLLMIMVLVHWHSFVCVRTDNLPYAIE